MRTATLSLIVKQRAMFRRDGFLMLPVVTTPREVAWMRTALKGLFAGRVGWREGDLFDMAGTDDDGPTRQPQLLAVSKHEPALAHTLFWANALAIGRGLLGPRAR